MQSPHGKQGIDYGEKESLSWAGLGWGRFAFWVVACLQVNDLVGVQVPCLLVEAQAILSHCLKQPGAPCPTLPPTQPQPTVATP